MRNYISILFCFICIHCYAKQINVGVKRQYKKLTTAINFATVGDTIIVDGGFYSEGNIVIDKAICLLGIGLPVIDGNKKTEVFSVKSSDVCIKGFKIQRSGYSTLDDPCGIKVYNANNVVIEGNIIYDNYFGIYIQYGKHCIIKNNKIIAFGVEEQQIGNGIHCWKSDSLQIIGNDVSGHRDGIYFEFVTHSIIWRNISHGNLRYGLHFMFSNNDSYITNVFSGNGAGVAVMYTNNVVMINNKFEQNWGDAAYGLLLKDISDSYISGNQFIQNTSGIYMEGTNRILVEKNLFEGNGWGMKIQASCMDNVINKNNFIANTFDVSTNGTLVLNNFNNNYWDRYEGYDLNKDNIGDVPYHPLSIFSVIVENNSSAMLLYRSFIVTLLDKTEKVIPSLTPDNFIDNTPMMSSWPI
jgi:nitrous oxidase accessory protein